ncbi:response regulator transcription factor [Phyllobacterium sp. YR531]|uniref:response regulator transcription factor n=1 Tax=Phyllobacterium sp. YR531 TaxID=1144343 RepID=UPI00026FA12C|nr:response regulator transcription factor [Phyllobacterium sp. YR531]EJN05391.1 response regulator containing a CheY-like receiver domain and an HTH DNA-binding domain [Phyllobacterium sp. YR531]
MKYTLVIVDDHPLFRGALKLALSSSTDNVEIIEIGDLDGAKELITSSLDIDLILLDLSLNGIGGMTGLISLRSLQPLVPIAIVSATDDPVTIRAALGLGASGFISKASTPEVISTAVQTILDGGIWSPLIDEEQGQLDADLADLIKCIRKLTPQQARVLDLMADGMLNKQIAHDLNVSEATIKAHVSAVLYKLGVESRTQAVIRIARFKEEAAPVEISHAGLQ